jgi:hypothetical protein
LTPVEFEQKWKNREINMEFYIFENEIKINKNGQPYLGKYNL